ncbi:MAG: LTA synthase family protein [Gammaproteobacteria bacterium]|nr:LTA synthase family protein [Gammaproteobacteria bacterium]
MPKLLKFILIIVVVMTVVFNLLRIAFFYSFSDANSPMSGADLLQSFWLGFRFDLRLAIIMILPLFFIGWIKRLSPFYTKFFKGFWLTYLVIIFFLAELVYIIDFGHYSYLSSRVNFTVFRFFEDATLSAQMVWESYPVIWIVFGSLISISIFALIVIKAYRYVDSFQAIKFSRWKQAVIGFVSFWIVLFGMHSKFSQYPLRWSEATFSQHPFAAQLTYNPIHYIFDTWKNGRITFSEEKTRKYYPLISDYLDVDNKDAEKLNYIRKIKSLKNQDKKPNIVLIIVESYASYKTSLSGNPLDPTPFTAALADKGYYFKNFFTPSTGTARSIFTTITSMPDVELKGTSSRNPLIVDQHSIMNEFEGYEKYYFIGGSASWGNIRGILTKNIDNLHLHEEDSYSSPRNDVWGISDYDLFKEANLVLEKESKPFIAIIQTSGNHRPYTIPENITDFELKHPGDAEAKKHGFDNEGEFNAYRLMDHSIQYYVNLAKNSAYDQNTLFALWGDHGLNGYAGKHSLKADSYSELNIGSHRVPFVIWSPGLINETKQLDAVVSEVDVLATMAALAGQDYTASAMGRDMFDSRYDKSRFAFTILHTNPPQIGMISKDHYFKMLSNGTNMTFHDIHSNKPLEDIKKQFPEQVSLFRDLTLGYYETVQYMLYHNKRDAVIPNNTGIDKD